MALRFERCIACGRELSPVPGETDDGHGTCNVCLNQDHLGNAPCDYDWAEKTEEEAIMDHQKEIRIERFEGELLEALRVCSGTWKLNAPNSFLMAGYLSELGKPVKDLTLGDLQAAYDRLQEHRRVISHLGELTKISGLVSCDRQKEFGSLFFLSDILADPFKGLI